MSRSGHSRELKYLQLQNNQSGCHACDKRRDYSTRGECSRRKKLKTDDNSPDFSLLPEIVIIKIFSFLSVDERCNAAQVCRKWYQISRSACLWKQVTLNNMTASKLIRALPELPSSVRRLQLSCVIRQRLFPMWLPDVLAKLNQRCRNLRMLVLEGAALVRHLCYGCSNEAVINAMLESLNTELLDSANSNLSAKARQCYEREYLCSEPSKDLSALLPCLEVLSLRKTMFNTFLFFSQISDWILPNIKVLDLTCALRSYARHISLYSRIEFLEELYLPGSVLSDLDTETLLKSAVRLKVLDVEHTDIGEMGIKAIKKYGKCLEKLFLANTKFTSFQMTLADGGNVLPRLNTLCVRTTPITHREVERLLHNFHTLRQVDVTFTEISLNGFTDLSEAMKEKLVLESDAEYLPYCDHFYSSSRYK